MKRQISKFLKTKKGKLAVVIIFLSLSVLAFWSYNVYQVRKDAQRFEEASALVDQIYADIVAELGQPEDSERTNFCNTRYQEFTGYGDPSCDVGIAVIYGVSDKSAAIANVAKVRAVLVKYPQLKLHGGSDNDIASGQIGNVTVQEAFNTYTYRNLECSTKYLFDSPAEARLSLKNDGIKSFYISFGCYGEAKSQIYPNIQ